MLVVEAKLELGQIANTTLVILTWGMIHISGLSQITVIFLEQQMAEPGMVYSNKRQTVVKILHHVQDHTMHTVLNQWRTWKKAGLQQYGTMPSILAWMSTARWLLYMLSNSMWSWRIEIRVGRSQAWSENHLKEKKKEKCSATFYFTKGPAILIWI